jgi:cytochrome P450
MVASTERKYDLYGPEFRADPACVFAQMREHDPVVRQPGIDGETPIWFVARHDDVTAVLLERRALRTRPSQRAERRGARGAQRGIRPRVAALPVAW